MYMYFNNNPLGRRTVGDCSVRAVSKALGVSWDEAHDMLADMSKQMGTIMNDNDVISAVLRMHGFYRENLPCTNRDCYTVREFANHNPVGTYVVGTGSHVVCIIDGDYYDSWPSDSEFIRIIKDKKMDDVLFVMDEMMEELQAIAPKLYYETMERLNRA